MGLEKGFMVIVLGVVLIGIFAIGTNLYINMNAAIDNNSNVTSDYEDVYQTTTDINVQTISVVQYVPMIIAAGVLIYSLLLIRRR